MRRATTTFRTCVLLVLLVAAACSSPRAPGGPTPSPAPVPSAASALANPVLGQGADPFVVVVDGVYHDVSSSSDGQGVSLRSSRSLATLATAPEKEVFRGGSHGSPCCEWWAPEVHRIGSRWYVYVAADDGDNDHHRTYVLSAPAVTGPYRYEGQLRLPGNRWAIDATVFTLADASYVVWSGWPGAENGEQDLYLGRLDSPTEVSGKAVRISRPERGWERHAGSVGVHVNEGPAALVSGGRVFLTYSASGCWTPQYALGMLTADIAGNLLDPASWQKSPTPVFAPTVGSGLYGTGHNNFFTSPDGRQTWIVYHAVTNPEGSCGDDREVYAQPITFAADGRPQLGTPSSAAVPLPSGDPGS